jgi:hypothetical protein
MNLLEVPLNGNWRLTCPPVTNPIKEIEKKKIEEKKLLEGIERVNNIALQ